MEAQASELLERRSLQAVGLAEVGRSDLAVPDEGEAQAASAEQESVWVQPARSF